MANFLDYPDVEIPSFAVKLGFVDKSWHNDAAALMVRRDLLLWVSESDPSLREFLSAKKFTLVRGMCGEPESQKLLLESDDEQAIVEYLNQLFSV